MAFAAGNNLLGTDQITKLYIACIPADFNYFSIKLMSWYTGSLNIAILFRCSPYADSAMVSLKVAGTDAAALYL